MLVKVFGLCYGLPQRKPTVLVGNRNPKGFLMDILGIRKWDLTVNLQLYEVATDKESDHK